MTLLTMVKFVGFDYFDSIIRDTGAFNLLVERLSGEQDGRIKRDVL